MARTVYPDNHTFADGMSFKNVRDAVVAASMIGMWHVARELAVRYRVEDMICLKCGVPDLNPQRYMYYSYGGQAIRICLKCNRGDGRALPR